MLLGEQGAERDGEAGGGGGGGEGSCRAAVVQVQVCWGGKGVLDAESRGGRDKESGGHGSE